MGKRTLATADHYRWGDGCDGWHLVNDPSLSVIRERMPPGTSEVTHRHQRARQFFWVLSGSATFEMDGRRFDVGPGEGVEVPPGAWHGIVNAGADALEFLVVSHPHSHGDRELSPSPSPGSEAGGASWKAPPGTYY